MQRRLSSPSLDSPSAAITRPPFPPTSPSVFVSCADCNFRPFACPSAPPPQPTNPPTRQSGLEYETGQLAFLMDATVSATVMWHGHTTYPFTFSIHDYYIKVSDTTDYDRSLCNCTQMMQGARQPWQEQQQQQGWRRRSEASHRLQAEGQGRAGALAADEVLLPPLMMDENGEGHKVTMK